MKKHIIHLNIFISKLIVLIFVCSTSLLSFSQDTKHNQTLNDSLSVKAEKNYEFTNQDTKVPLRFQTDAERLTVKFITKDTKKLKSNTNNTKTELYCKTTDGKWVKIDGKYFFGDTTVCVFDRLLKNEGYVNNQEYFLFFSAPINKICWWYFFNTQLF